MLGAIVQVLPNHMRLSTASWSATKELLTSVELNSVIPDWSFVAAVPQFELRRLAGEQQRQGGGSVSSSAWSYEADPLAAWVSFRSPSVTGRELPTTRVTASCARDPDNSGALRMPRLVSSSSAADTASRQGLTPACSFINSYVDVRASHELAAAAPASSSGGGIFTTGSTRAQIVRADGMNCSFSGVVLDMPFAGNLRRTLTIKFCSSTTLIPCISLPLAVAPFGSVISAMAVTSQPYPSLLAPSAETMALSFAWAQFTPAYFPIPRGAFTSITGTIPGALSFTAPTAVMPFLGSGGVNGAQVRFAPQRELLRDGLVAMQLFVAGDKDTGAWTLPMQVQNDGPADFVDSSMMHIVALIDMPLARFDAASWRQEVGAHFQIEPDRIVVERVGRAYHGGSGSTWRPTSWSGTRVEFHVGLPSTTTVVKLSTAVLERQIITFRDKCTVAGTATGIRAVYDGGQRQPVCDARFLRDRAESARHCEVFGGTTGRSQRCSCFESIFSEGVAAACAADEFMIPLCDYLRACNKQPSIDEFCDRLLPVRAVRVVVVFFTTVGSLIAIGLLLSVKARSVTRMGGNQIKLGSGNGAAVQRGRPSIEEFFVG